MSDSYLACFRTICTELSNFCAELSQGERAAAGMTTFYYVEFEKTCVDAGRSPAAILQALNKFEAVQAAVRSYRKMLKASTITSPSTIQTTPLKLLSRYMELKGDWRKQYARNKLFRGSGLDEHVCAVMAAMKETDDGYTQRLSQIDAMLTEIEATQ